MKQVKTRTFRAAALATSLALIAIAASTPELATAAGNSYHVWTCDAAPTHAPSGWTSDASEGMDADRLCPSNNDIRRGLVARNRTNEEGVPQGASARTAFSAPAGTRLKGIEYAWSGYRRSGNWAVGLSADGRWVAGCTTPGAGECQFAHAVGGSAHADLGGARDVAVEVRCVEATGCPTGHSGDESQAGLRARASLRWALIEIEDQQDPGVSELGGGLLTDGWLTGAQSVEFSAGDNTGISATKVLLDGQPVDELEHPCVFARPVPCAAARHSFSLDTRTLSDGEHRVELQALDAAGNSGRETRSIRVDNTPPTASFARRTPADPDRLAVRAADGASGVAGGRVAVRRLGSSSWHSLSTALVAESLVASLPSRLAAGDYEARAYVVDRAGHATVVDRYGDGEAARFTLAAPSRIDVRLAGPGVKRGKRPTLDYGSRPNVTGQVRSGGDRLRRVPIRILSRDRVGGADWRVEGRARTDGRGRFEQRLAAGASRDIRVRFDGSDRHQAAQDEVSIAVRASATLKPSNDKASNGSSVVFSGRVRGGPIPAGGKLVDLQAHYRGRWRTFALPRTDGRGRWRQRYKFGATSGVVEYRFRARVPRERSYPYLPTRSRATTVVVDGD